VSASHHRLAAGLCFITMNLGAALLTVAVLMGFKVSLIVMFPLPLVGAQMGIWSMNTVILGFTGIYLVLACMILLYPLLGLSMLFFGKKRQDLVLSERSLNDPGMLGMTLSALTLLIAGLPLVVVGTTLLLALYGVIPMSMAAWAAEPVVFQYVFFIFAHNLMEAMALMVSSAMYATLPLYLADGTRKLFSDKLANTALWILLLTSVTSFLHHFITFYPEPAGGAVLLGQHHELGHRHRRRDQHLHRAGDHLAARPARRAGHHRGAARLGAVHPRWRQRHGHLQRRLGLRLHGTMWQSGHTMTVILAMSLMWMGVLYHHYPVITGRKLDPALGTWFVRLFTVGGFGAAIAMLAGGAAGMPRRFADWNQEGWMVYGNMIMIFGLILGASFVVYAYNLLQSRDLNEAMGQRVGAT
jgi:cytochrome c oxidase subunit 1